MDAARLGSAYNVSGHEPTNIPQILARPIADN